MDRVFYKVQNAKTERQCENIANEYEQTFRQILCTRSPEKLQKVDKLLLAVIRTGHARLIRVIAVEIVQHGEAIDWTTRADLVDAIVACVKSGYKPNVARTRPRNYSDFFKSFTATLRTRHLLEAYSVKLFEIVQTSLNTADPQSPIHTASAWCADAIAWTSHLDLAAKGTVQLVDFVKANPTLTAGYAYQTCVRVLEAAYRSHARGLSLSDDEEANDDRNVGVDDGDDEQPSANSISSLSELYVYVLPYITDLFKFCCSRRLPREGGKSLSYVCLCSILDNFLNQGDLDPEVVEPMLAEIVWLRTCGNANLQSKALSVLAALCNTEPSLVVDQLDSLLELYLAGQAADVGHSLTSIYEVAPDKIESRLDSLLNAMKKDQSQLYLVPQVLTQVAKRSIDLIKDHHIKLAVDMYDDSTMCYYGTMFLEQVAQTRLADVSKYEATLVNVLTTHPNYFGLACNLLAILTSNDAEAKAYLKMLAELLTTQYQVFTRKYIIDAMCSIGKSYPHELAPYRAQFDSLRKLPDLRANCQEAINIIDQDLASRRPSAVAPQIADTVSEQQQDLIAQLSTIREPEESTGPLTEGFIEIQIENINNTSRKTQKQTNTAESTHWLTQVSQLLNEYDVYDWRSVAVRLGYSNDDIRQWLREDDPCLAMLQRWLASNSAPTDATYAVYRVLLDVSRNDAAEIVQQALAHSHSPVALSGEKQSVFLSYQWASMRQVKLIRQHLALAGYAAWMDVHAHMHANSDAALKAAAVVVCCVSELYAQSASCSREVTLAVSLGKPIVALLLENSKWPPSGPIGPIFSDRLSIRFFRSDSNKTVFWRNDKFSELLMQLRHVCAPDQSSVPRDSPYRNWWLPAPDLTPKTGTNLKSDRLKQLRQSTVHDVFISYQWDMQPYVKLLYLRLTQLGYTCWFDVLHMGGEAPLYDKIERGVNSCTVVLSCVSKKYALSTSCRREVSLADWLKKPIVPILLEAVQWPPKGLAALRQLAYIDFSDDVKLLNETQSSKFDALVRSIDSCINRRSMLSPGSLTRPHSTVSDRNPASGRAAYSARNLGETLPKLPDRISMSMSKRASAANDANTRTSSATRLPQL